MPIEKSAFDSACSKTHWNLSIEYLIEYSSFTNSVNVFLKTCRGSTAYTALLFILNLAWT